MGHDIQIRLTPEPARPEILAYASLLYGALCVRGIKVVKVQDGTIRVVFPDRAVRAGCVACTMHIPITHRHCHHCGAAQPFRAPERKPNGKPILYQGLVFPVSRTARAELEQAVLAAFEAAWSIAQAG